MPHSVLSTLNMHTLLALILTTALCSRWYSNRWAIWGRESLNHLPKISESKDLNPGTEAPTSMLLKLCFTILGGVMSPTRMPALGGQGPFFTPHFAISTMYQLKQGHQYITESGTIHERELTVGSFPCQLHCSAQAQAPSSSYLSSPQSLLVSPCGSILGTCEGRLV